MLTDTKLRNLKPRDKLYKVNDREGLYVGVCLLYTSPSPRDSLQSRMPSSA